MSGIMVNWDDTCLFLMLHEGMAKEIHTRDQAIRWLCKVTEQYAGTQVTDFLMCVNSRNSVFPSRVMESRIDKWNQTKENGISVNYQNTHVKEIRQFFLEYHIDIFEIWIQNLRKIGIRPWISIRMNDVHDTLQDTSVLAPNFFYEHPEYRRTHHHRPDYWQASAYDYEQEPVRKLFLDYIEECLERYDAEGLELDWMRELTCFRYGHEETGRNITLEFMRSTAKLIKKYEMLRGHRILLSVRMPASPETAFSMGFDVLQWAAEGLIDMAVPSPRWSTTDMDLPVAYWKRLLAPYPVQIAAGMEALMRETPANPYTFHCAETAAAMAVSAFSAGADRIYLYNFMSVFHCGEKHFRYNEFAQRDEMIVHKLGSLESALKQPRRHLVSWRDGLPFWEQPFIQLPVSCQEIGHYAKLRIRTGIVPEFSEVRLLLGINSNITLKNSDLEVYCNTEYLPMQGISAQISEYTNFPLYQFILSPAVLTQENVLEIGTRGLSFVIEYAEIKITPVRTDTL